MKKKIVCSCWRRKGDKPHTQLTIGHFWLIQQFMAAEGAEVCHWVQVVGMTKRPT